MLHQAPSTGDSQARLVGRAMTDDTFRQQLLASPKAAIEQELGVSLPAELEVVVVEETASRLCLVLPARSFGANEMSEQDLSAVSGGMVHDPPPPPPDLGMAYSFARLNRYFRRF
jgi:hypothetical protein